MMNTEWTTFLAKTAINLPAFLAGISFHEFSHAATACLLGDDTAKNDGRLTLNPISHIDPIGMLCLLFLGFGWAKPVPVNIRNFKHPRFYDILTSVAGPLSNFILAIIFFAALKYFPLALFSPVATVTFIQILKAAGTINIMLGVLNLLPIPPLDGSHILITFISHRYPQFVNWLYRYSMFILLFLFMLEPVQYFLHSLIFNIQNIILQIIF